MQFASKIFKSAQFSVKQQFLIINALMIVFGIGLSMLTVLVLNKLEKSQAQIKAANLIALEGSRLKGLLSEKGDAIKSLLIDPTNKLESDRKKQTDEQLTVAFGEMQLIAKGTTLEEPLKKLIEFSTGGLKSNEDDIMKDISANKKDDANFKYVIMYFPLRRTLDKQCDDFATAAQKLANDQVQEIGASVVGATRMVLALQAAGVLFVVFALWMIGRSLVTKMQSMSQHLVDASHSIRERSTSQMQQAAALSNEMVEAANFLRSTASAAEEITTTVERNAEMAEGSKRLSEKGRETVEQGHVAVEDMLRSIQNIHTNNKEMGEQIEGSFQDLERISDLFKTIHDKTLSINAIVLQTRLLSFNASVEASRAGEHGRGFAVVAEEVGKLAQASGMASREIEELLSSSTSQVSKVIKSVRDRLGEISRSSEQKVKQSTTSAERCRELFSSIMSDVSQINTKIGDIFASSKEQAIGVREITQSVRHVDDAIQKNTQRAQEGATQSQEIQNQAEFLETVVSDMERMVVGQSQTPVKMAS